MNEFWTAAIFDICHDAAQVVHMKVETKVRCQRDCGCVALLWPFLL